MEFNLVIEENPLPVAVVYRETDKLGEPIGRIDLTDADGKQVFANMQEVEDVAMRLVEEWHRVNKSEEEKRLAREANLAALSPEFRASEKEKVLAKVESGVLQRVSTERSLEA